MARNSYLMQRGGSYVYRRDIPARFRPALGKSAWWIVLKTDSLSKAEAMSRVHAKAHDDILARLETIGSSAAILEQIKAIEGNAQDAIQHMTRAFYAIPRDERDTRLEAVKAVIKDRTQAKVRELTKHMIRAAQAKLKNLPVTHRAQIESEGGLQAAYNKHESHLNALLLINSLPDEMREPGTPDRALPKEERLRLLDEHDEWSASVEDTKAQLARLHELLAPLGIVDESTPTSDGPTVNSVFDEWLAHRKQRPDTARKWKVYVRRFVELHGDLPIARVTKAHVRDYVSTLAKLPDSREVKPEARKGTIKELLTWRDKNPDSRPINAVTVGKHLHCIKALFAWATRHDYMETNVAHSITPPHDDRDDDERVRAFTSAELKRVVDGARKQWGVTSDKYMMLMTAIWTGARLEEVAQLHKSDMQQDGEIWYIHIRPGDGRAVKNKPSKRRIPLHPKLIAAGFVEHAATDGTRIFGSLSNGSTGRYGHAVSNAFHRLCDKVGLTDSQLNWHSLRHSFTTACRGARVPVDVRYRLEGHKGINPIAEGYGEEYPISVLHEWVSKIDPFAS